MGLFEWGMNKLEKKLKEEFSQEDQEQEIKTDEVEKASYSEYSYKNVQRLREKGKYWAIDVPYLQYPVTKQDKPRPLFLVFGIISLILLGFVCYGAYMMTVGIILPMISSALSLNGLFTIHQWDFLGLFVMFSSLAPFILWILIILFSVAIISIVVYFILLTRKLFCLSKISMQEMAKGYEIRNMLLALGTIMVLILVIGLVLLVPNAKNMTAGNIAIVVVVMVGLIAIVGVVFALLLVQRNKEKKLFEQLPEEQQQDFIKHNRALERTRSRRNRTDNTFGSSEVDF
ncbi:MAG: hypothetical protein E7351_02730 [Clostridiales bacterium]|nr:hypothetical protein [Clostridiales bacterium]